MNNLGYLNDWCDNPPKKYETCRKKKHKLIPFGTNLTYVVKYVCNECKIEFLVDSGD